MQLLLVAALVLALPLTAGAQAAFEVASIRPSEPRTSKTYKYTPTGLFYTGASLVTARKEALKLTRVGQIGLPDMNGPLTKIALKGAKKPSDASKDAAPSLPPDPVSVLNRALRPYGLSLQPRTSPVQVLVVDRANQIPTAN